MKSRVVNNAMWIIGCKVAQAILGLVVSMMTARYLGPSNYGLINYAISLVAFLTPVLKLGLDSTIVQEIVSRDENSEGRIMGTTVGLTGLSAILCMVGLVAFTLIADPGETETHLVCAIYSVIMLAYAAEMLQYWFQAKLLSKYTSITMLLAYVVMTAYQIFLLVTRKSIYWFAFSRTLDVIVVDVILFFLYKKFGSSALSFSWEEARRLLDKSKHYILSGIMVVVFAQTDKIMLKMMIDDAATGYYSAAVTIAAMTTFVFSAIITSAQPSIFASKNEDEQAFEGKLTKLYSVIIYLSLAQCVFFTLFAKLIVRLLYGAAYAPSIAALQVVIWYTTFSFIGPVRNIWILAENKQSILWKINLSGALANVFLNLVLIPPMGIIGAAIASLVTQFFTNVVTGFLFSSIRRSNTIMLRGLNPSWGVEFAKAYLSRLKRRK